MNTKVVGRFGRVALAVVGIGYALTTGIASGQGNDSDEKLAKRIAAIDKKLVKACAELATYYDKEGDVEAASFFAECAIGFGSQDEKVKAIKMDGEIKVYMGKVQGGKALDKITPIRSRLDGPMREYKEILDELTQPRKLRNLSKKEDEVLRDVVVKYELARGADEYVQTTKRINELRKAMKLRSVLWDFENSKKTILGAWYVAETGDAAHNQPDKQKTVYHTEGAKFPYVDTAAVWESVLSAPTGIRTYALIREPLLHPNARRLWLGHWKGDHFAKDFAVTSYYIPLVPYREDIPTPTKRYEGETVAKDWVDTEEIFEVNGKKIPFVRYPYEDEPDAPWSFGDPGKADIETGWNESEHAFIGKAGVPIMLRFFGKAGLTDVEAKITFGSEKEVPSRLYRDGDERVPGMDKWPTMLLVPTRELERGTKYTVTMKCKVNGVAFEKTWSFRTRPRD